MHTTWGKGISTETLVPHPLSLPFHSARHHDFMETSMMSCWSSAVLVQVWFTPRYTLLSLWTCALSLNLNNSSGTSSKHDSTLEFNLPHRKLIRVSHSLSDFWSKVFYLCQRKDMWKPHVHAGWSHSAGGQVKKNAVIIIHNIKKIVKSQNVIIVIPCLPQCFFIHVHSSECADTVMGLEMTEIKKVVMGNFSFYRQRTSLLRQCDICCHVMASSVF